MTEPIRISDAQRRARLVARHHLARTAADIPDVVRAVVALHSSDPATPYLATRTRLADFSVARLDRSLYDERSLWRLHAMRRTLFVVPAAEGAVFEAAASRDVARKERRRLEGWLGAEMAPERVPGFLAGLEARVLEVLADGRERRTRDLVASTPDLGLEITLGSGKWTTRSPLSSRLLFLMAMDLGIVRTRPAGSWRSSQYGWTATSAWFGSVPEPLDPATARVELARRYLASHGPASLADLRWWTGWTARQTRAATDALGAVTVRLEGGGEALVLPEDTDPVEQGPAAAALLPALDPTPMGWTGRDWFLGPHASEIFDRSGNIGPSVWVHGRIVGGWAQRPAGEVVYRLLEDVGREDEEDIAREAAALTAWMDGAVVIPRFRTPLERRLRDGNTG